MPWQATVYRILIASPSDVTNERKAIQEVIHSWNAVNSRKYGVMLEPVLWETHATPEMGDRPQAIINKQLVEDCDILIGTFWTRIGTHTGKAESGTIEEIEKFIDDDKPVLLYFSSAPVVPDSIDPDQYKRLMNFKKKCKREGLVSEYDSIGELREKLQRHITSTINSLHKVFPEGYQKAETDEEETQRSALEMFKSQFESFLRHLESEWNAERDSGPFNIDEGKHILEKACSEVLNFKAQIVNEEGSKVAEILSEAAERLKAIQRHMLYIDGGQSSKAFWTEGDQIVGLLKRVPEEINNMLQEVKRVDEKDEPVLVKAKECLEDWKEIAKLLTSSTDINEDTKKRYEEVRMKFIKNFVKIQNTLKNYQIEKKSIGGAIHPMDLAQIKTNPFEHYYEYDDLYKQITDLDRQDIEKMSRLTDLLVEFISSIE